MGHIVCCNDHDRTVCNQSLAVVGPSNDSKCGMCSMVAKMRPLPCPLGGHCTKVGQPALAIAATLEMDEARALSGISDMLRGKVGDPVRADKQEVPLGMRWWSRDNEPTTKEFSDEQLLNFIYERYRPLSAHQVGNHHCPCWRCAMLRKAGYYPELLFDQRSNDYYLKKIREATG